MADFWLGFAAGFIAAGIFGLVAQWFSLRRTQWNAMTRPQVVTHQTDRTPWQVISAGLQAGCLITIALFLIGVILWLILDSSV